MELEKPMAVKEETLPINEKIKGLRLLNFETNHPENGNPSKELIGIRSNKFPNSASFKSKYIFNVGIRDAQDEKQIPEIKK